MYTNIPMARIEGPIHTGLDQIMTRMTRLIHDARDTQVVEDSIAMARIEGLEGHARAAEMRKLP